MVNFTKVRHLLIVLIGLITLLALVASGCSKQAPVPAPGPTPTPTPSEVYNIKYETIWGPEYFSTKEACMPFVEATEKESNGRIKFEVYHAQALVKTSEAYQGLKSGIVNMVSISPNYEAGKMPRGDIFGMPFSLPMGIPNPEVRAEIMKEVFENGCAEEIDPRVKVVAFSTTSEYRVMTTKKKVTTLADVKGLKLRSSGGFHTEIIKSMEGVPVTVGPGDVAQALQTGVMDGVYHTYAAIYGWGAYDPLDYAIDHTSSVFPQYWAMDKATYDKLPKDLQDILVKNAQKYIINVGPSYHKAEKEYFPKMGIEEVKLSQAEKDRIVDAVAPVWQIYVDNAQKAGFDAKTVIGYMADSWKKHGFTPPAVWSNLAK